MYRTAATSGREFLTHIPFFVKKMLACAKSLVVQKMRDTCGRDLTNSFLNPGRASMPRPSEETIMRHHIGQRRQRIIVSN
jgi:hypothetical protein